MKTGKRTEPNFALLRRSRQKNLVLISIGSVMVWLQMFDITYRNTLCLYIESSTGYLLLLWVKISLCFSNCLYQAVQLINHNLWEMKYVKQCSREGIKFCAYECVCVCVPLYSNCVGLIQLWATDIFIVGMQMHYKQDPTSITSQSDLARKSSTWDQNMQHTTSCFHPVLRAWVQK